MLMVDWNGLQSAVGGLTYFIVVAVIAVLILIIGLKLGIKAVKNQNDSFGTVFLTAIFLAIIYLVCFYIPVTGWLAILVDVIGFILGLVVIMLMHKTSFLGALGAEIIAVIIVIIIVVIILVVLYYTGIFVSFTPIINAFGFTF
jgi:hypothetical protein